MREFYVPNQLKLETYPNGQRSIVNGDITIQDDYLRDGLWHDTRSNTLRIDLTENDDDDADNFKFDFECIHSDHEKIGTVTLDNIDDGVKDRTVICKRPDESIMAKWNLLHI